MGDFQIIKRPGVDELGEGPLWSVREQALFWVDILGQQLHRYEPDTEAIRSWDMPRPICWIIERRFSAGFVVGLADGLYELCLDPYSLKPVGKRFVRFPDCRLNDAKAHPDGTIYAGTKDETGGTAGALYRINASFTTKVVDAGYRIANGPAILRDGRTMYHTDSAERAIHRLTLDEAGGLSERALFLRFPVDGGEPDGMTLDSEGGLWVAHWGDGRVSRFTQDGRLDRTIELPASQITSCTFGGAKLDRLYVTSAATGVDDPAGGALFELRPGVTGIAPCQFAG